MPAVKLAEATHVSGVLNNEPDERGTLVVIANLKGAAPVALSLNLN